MNPKLMTDNEMYNSQTQIEFILGRKFLFNFSFNLHLVTFSIWPLDEQSPKELYLNETFLTI